MESLKPKLTKKQRGFVKDYVETGNGTQSALKNYNTTDEATAAAIAYENLNKPQIAAVISSLADRIPDDLVIQKHLALLNKKEMKRTFNQELGEWIEIETGQVDTEAVKAGVKMAYDLKGAFAPTKSQSVHLNVEAHMEDATAEALRKEYEEKLKLTLYGPK